MESSETTGSDAKSLLGRMRMSGIDPHNFTTTTQSVILHSEYPVAHEPEPESLSSCVPTLFTLFFAERDYAPICIVDSENIQDCLPRHFIASFGALADRLHDADDLLDKCVIGWDSMNEPAEGFCGYEDLNSVPEEQGSALRNAQSLCQGMGQEQTVEHWSFWAKL